jgi:hypothetical protein
LEQFDMWARRSEHVDAVVNRPLEEPAQIVPVRLKRSSAVPGQERSRYELSLITLELRFLSPDDRRGRLDRGHS